jgi:hypothetical protein
VGAFFWIVWEIFKKGYFQGVKRTGRGKMEAGKAVKKRDKVCALSLLYSLL